MEHVIKSHPDYHNIHKDKPINEVIRFLNQKLLKRPYMNRLNVNPCYHGSRLLAYPNLRGSSTIVIQLSISNFVIANIIAIIFTFAINVKFTFHNYCFKVYLNIILNSFYKA